MFKKKKEKSMSSVYVCAERKRERGGGGGWGGGGGRYRQTGRHADRQRHRALCMFGSRTPTFTCGCVCYNRREGEPPLVPGHFLWGNGADFAEHAVRFLHKSQKALGDIFTIRLLNQHLTMVMDPHCFEQFSKEKNFDFDPIQKQVNNNVFSFELKEARKMISEAGKKVNGKYLSSGLESFASNLKTAFTNLRKQGNDVNGNVDKEKGWSEGGLRTLTANTLFNALFYTIFGRPEGTTPIPATTPTPTTTTTTPTSKQAPADEKTTFNPSTFYENFDLFHKVFNFLWLGLPVWLFPKATQALKILCQQPSAEEMMNRDGVSEYIKFSTSYMLQNGQTATDIVGHNLVFLHVNYNTFRVTFWCIYRLLQQPQHVRDALFDELREAVQQKREEGNDQVGFTIEDFDKLPLLGEYRICENRERVLKNIECRTEYNTLSYMYTTESNML